VVVPDGRLRLRTAARPPRNPPDEWRRFCRLRQPDIQPATGETVQAWTDQKLRRGWLPDAKIEISTATTNQSVRAAWDVGKSRVGVYFYGKGEGKTQIAVDHLKLTSAKESARMKSNWREALDRLQKWLPVHLERD
jgi:hypothetical protein